MLTELRPAIVLCGQTASGKTSLAIELCRSFGGEIVSADSMQIYRGMDIGTAKPGKAELAAAVHHLIDIRDIGDAFSAAEFVALGREAMEDIVSRGRIPVVTGGTGLYSEMLFRSPALSEDRSDTVRGELNARAEREGAEALYAELCDIDPDSAARVHANNVRRVIRYLEVYYVTGKTATEMNKSNNSRGCGFAPLFVCLTASDREYIYSRINARVDAMFDAGLEDEARVLFEKGLADTPTASAAIGYKELFPYFRGEITLDAAKEAIKQNSRNYAKRQQTYFKRMSGVHTVDICESGYEERVTALVKEFLTEFNGADR